MVFMKASTPNWNPLAFREKYAIAPMAIGENCDPKTEIDWPI
jgi:hypothetical protein